MFTARYGLSILIFKTPFHCSGSQSPGPHRGGQSSKQDSACEICGGQSDTGNFFSPTTSVFTCIIPPMPHIHINLNVALTRRTNGRNLGTFQKETLFRKSGSIRWKSIFTCLSLWTVKFLWPSPCSYRRNTRKLTFIVIGIINTPEHRKILKFEYACVINVSQIWL